MKNTCPCFAVVSIGCHSLRTSWEDGSTSSHNTFVVRMSWTYTRPFILQVTIWNVCHQGHNGTTRKYCACLVPHLGEGNRYVLEVQILTWIVLLWKRTNSATPSMRLTAEWRSFGPSKLKRSTKWCGKFDKRHSNHTTGDEEWECNK